MSVNKLTIQIKGIPGSGKSYIGAHLPKNIKCLDTDTYITMAYESSPSATERQIQALAHKMINAEIRKHAYVCVVGILLNVRAHRKYFIKIPRDEMEAVFSRTIVRELEKYKSVRVSTNGMSAEEISNMLRFKYHAGAIDPVYTTLMSYKQLYKRALTLEKSRGLIIMKQADIIGDVIKYVNENC